MRGGFSPPFKLGPAVNSGDSDTSPHLSADEQTLLFYSTRPGGFGRADLYVSRRTSGAWAPAENLGQTVNTAESEYNPFLSPDGRTLYFGRNGNIMTVPCAVSVCSVANSVVHDSGAALERVGRGAYAIVHADAVHTWPEGSTDWPHGNNGVVVGKRCVLVVDATFYPGRAAADIALIRKITSAPICYLVNTHWHGDHTHGNAVYKTRFPDLQIVGTRENAGHIDVMQKRFGSSITRDSSAPQQELIRLRRIHATGADNAGRQLSAEERDLLERVIGELETEVRELGDLKVATAPRLFEGELSLELGGVTARITSRGRANSPDDITVSVDRDGVMFAGDIVVYPVPFAFGAFPTHWERVLQTLESQPIHVLVPGHGPVMHDLKYVGQLRELMGTLIQRVTVLMATGASLADIKKNVRLDDLEARFVSPGIVNSGPWWRDSVVEALIERTYKCVQGSEC